MREAADRSPRSVFPGIIRLDPSSPKKMVVLADELPHSGGADHHFLDFLLRHRARFPGKEIAHVQRMVCKGNRNECWWHRIRHLDGFWRAFHQLHHSPARIEALIATIGEYLYHSNVKTPAWLRYFIQTPELHSVHHQLDVHKFNFSDIPIWDRMFGTYKDAVEFVPACGFPKNNERKIFAILMFKDVYGD